MSNLELLRCPRRPRLWHPGTLSGVALLGALIAASAVAADSLTLFFLGSLPSLAALALMSWCLEDHRLLRSRTASAVRSQHSGVPVVNLISSKSVTPALLEVP